MTVAVAAPDSGLDIFTLASILIVRLIVLAAARRDAKPAQAARPAVRNGSVRAMRRASEP